MTRINKPHWTEDQWGDYLHLPDYNQEFNQRMKDIVPQEERRWDGKERAWWISHGWVDEIEALLREYYEDYVTTRDV